MNKQKEKSKEDELILDLVWQACGSSEDGLIDNMALSVYEEACVYLCKKGIIRKENDRFYWDDNILEEKK